MALSANAARALEQVKMGLYMLYGAAYFTEDEWIKIDGLIHKGQYVFTRGPQNNLLEEGELISFEGSMEEKTQLNVQDRAEESFNTTKADEAGHSPTSSEPAESTDGPEETPNGTSVEASDDEATQTQVIDTAVQKLDWATEMETSASISNERTEIPKRSTAQIPAAGGLALGYTQAQLEEVKMFNAGLTKAGEKKTRPKYTKEESYPSTEWYEGEAAASEQTKEDVYPSPTASQQETRIQSWAAQVKTQEPSVPEIASPKPQKGTSQPKITSLDDPNAKPLVEAFIRINGRRPKSIADIYQPKNPGFIPPDQRPLSRASNATSKTARSISNSKAIVPRPSTVSTTTTSATTATTSKPDHRLKAGKVFIAQRAAEKKSKICIEVRPGHHIKILKHVSGIMHLGLNLSTKQTGQFPESIFTLAPGVSVKQEALIEQQRALATTTQTSQVALRTRVQDVGTANGLDRVEGTNAAEWEDVSVVSRRTAPPSAPARKSVGGLSSSRYAVLADEEESPVPKQQETTSTTAISKEEISRLVDEKFAQIMAAQAATSAALNNHKPATPTGPRSKTPLKEPLKPVNPKTETCWFWATPNKDCRFTADECRDLHAFLPVSPSDPTNLRMGKPTWGALADSLPTPSHIEYAPGKASKTCFYWATEGKCEFTAETCKYLHAHCAAGVAPKPRDSWKRVDWSRLRKPVDGNASVKATENADGGNGWGNLAEVSDVNGGWGDYTPGDQNGELVLEEVQNDSWGTASGSVNGGWGNTNGWGESSGSSDDKYKPPHIKALEETAQISSGGW